MIQADRVQEYLMDNVKSIMISQCIATQKYNNIPESDGVIATHKILPYCTRVLSYFFTKYFCTKYFCSEENTVVINTQ